MEHEIFSFSQEKEFSSRREKALQTAEELEMPESIRTPGRTWTRYPELEPVEVEKISPSISIEGEAEVFTGQKAVEEAGERLLYSIKTDENRLNAYHAAFMNSLIYIEIEAEAEVEIVYSEQTPVFAHLVVETERNSDAAIREIFKGSPGIMTSFVELYIGQNADFRYGAVESADAELSYSRRKAVLDRDSWIKWNNGLFGSDLNRTKIETVLEGDNSETEKVAAWYPTGDQHIDISMNVDHRGAKTRCDMKSRAVVDDRARSVYEGLQNVGDRADDTSSFQDEKVLTLSERAEVDASPKLMIEDPEVEASHAASAGKIPEKKVHYLQSRGISREAAEKLAVEAFFQPLLDSLNQQSLRRNFSQQIESKIED